MGTGETYSAMDPPKGKPALSAETSLQPSSSVGVKGSSPQPHTSETSSALPPTAFDLLMKQIHSLPLWIKHVLYVDLRHELESKLTKSTLDAFSVGNTLPMWLPELTHQGVAVLKNKESLLHDRELQRLLQLVHHQKSVASMTLLCKWSLTQASMLLKRAIEQELIYPPHSVVILSTISYLLGEIRLGEYLVRINRLTIEQLDQALKTQKAIEESMGEPMGIATVLINLGFILKGDSESILFLKEESKTPLIWPDMGTIASASAAANQNISRLQHQLKQALVHIRQLEMTNEKLTKQLSERPGK